MSKSAMHRNSMVGLGYGAICLKFDTLPTRESLSKRRLFGPGKLCHRYRANDLFDSSIYFRNTPYLFFTLVKFIASRSFDLLYAAKKCRKNRETAHAWARIGQLLSSIRGSFFDRRKCARFDIAHYLRALRGSGDLINNNCGKIHRTRILCIVLCCIFFCN